MISVYALRDPNTGRYCYVGRAKDPKARLAGHLQANNHAMVRWLRALHTTGRTPELIILDTMPGEWSPAADPLERQWIHRLIQEGHPLLNHYGIPDDFRELHHILTHIYDGHHENSP